MEKQIRIIEPLSLSMPKKKRVAAYCRVSLDKETMLHSLETQVSYYRDKITSNPLWEFGGIYADEGLTGTKQNRPEFNRLIADCRAGKIDKILTKSISRFARNTVTTLSLVRELKEKGIAVFFENENIDTMSGDGEMMLTVLSSFAQEESHQVSENCKWRIHKGYAEGRLEGINFIYGYDLIDGRNLVVSPEQAEVVRMIFSDYLSGMGLMAIRTKLNKAGIPTLTGSPWADVTLRRMLSNEKYIGDVLQQKTFISDHLTKKQVKNRGNLDQYYYDEHHEPIISHATFLAVQDEIKRRAEKAKGSADKPTPERPAESFSFTGKIICAGCGRMYRRRTLNASFKWRKVFWQCNTYMRQGKDACMAKQIPEQALINITAGYKKPIQQISVSYPNLLTFTFEDGGTTTYEWSESDEYSHLSGGNAEAKKHQSHTR